MSNFALKRILNSRWMINAISAPMSSFRSSREFVECSKKNLGENFGFFIRKLKQQFELNLQNSGERQTADSDKLSWQKLSSQCNIA